MLGILFVNFMDRDGSMYDGGLDGLLLYDWLDGLTSLLATCARITVIGSYLMHMVVNMLSCNGRIDRMSLAGGCFCSGVVEVCTFLLKTLLHSAVLAMLVLAMFYGDETVLMLLWQDFTILNWLNGSMVMVLMNLSINSGGDLLMLLFLDVLLNNRRSYFLMDSSVMMT